MVARRTTLRDVAARAGVDASTVSRVLNLDPHLSVSVGTRQRILDAVGELDYQPNANARRLRMARTMAIGYLIPDLVNPANGPLVTGVQQRARAAGYAVLIGSSADSADTAESFKRLLGEGRVDGLLVNCGVLEDDEVISLASSSAPVVLVNRSVEGARASVVLDDEAAARAAADHLCGLGHRQLLHLAGPSFADTTQRRIRGFISAAAERGAIVTSCNASDWTDLAGFELAQDRLARNPACTAVFTDNVSLAVGALAAASDLGLSVPHDLSVVAMHDVPLAAHAIPRLTAVKTPLAKMGSASFDVLRAILQGGAPEPLTVVSRPAPFVVERASSTRPPTR